MAQDTGPEISESVVFIDSSVKMGTVSVPSTQTSERVGSVQRPLGHHSLDKSSLLGVYFGQSDGTEPAQRHRQIQLVRTAEAAQGHAVELFESDLQLSNGPKNTMTHGNRQTNNTAVILK